jgi:hypothetical protein
VISYIVVRRRNEIAVRIVLGAKRANVLSMVAVFGYRPMEKLGTVR